MAIYVGIRKVAENGDHVVYEFGPDEQRVGRIRISRTTGEVEVLSEVPGDDKTAYSPRAKRKLLLHWRKQEFPDTTCWAS